MNFVGVFPYSIHSLTGQSRILTLHAPPMNRLGDIECSTLTQRNEWATLGSSLNIPAATVMYAYGVQLTHQSGYAIPYIGHVWSYCIGLNIKHTSGAIRDCTAKLEWLLHTSMLEEVHTYTINKLQKWLSAICIRTYTIYVYMCMNHLSTL